MTGWATVTLKMDAECVYDDVNPPARFTIDSGMDERGWVDDETFYALSFGRYQDRRLHKHMEEMHCPKYSGVSVAVICETNNTDDKITSWIYKPKQRFYEDRVDGYNRVGTVKGDRFPEEELDVFKNDVENEFDISPVVEPRDSTTPADMILYRRESEE